MIYALINTMSQTDDTPGSVLSLHRSESAALKADDKFQRLVKRANGQHSYIPTAVYPLRRRPAGIFLGHDEVAG